MSDSKNTQTIISEQRYQRMIDEVQDYAIILLDVDGNIQNWNKGAQKIKGYSEKEILGKNFSIFYLAEDMASRLPYNLIAEASNNGRATHEGWRVRKDGTTFWGNVVITALHGENDEIIGFTKVTRDLTERKLAEEQKDRDAKSIELQNKQLEEFAYVTSHDLQEPIRKIRTFINLAKKSIGDVENTTKYLDKMDSSAEKMVQLIKDVLAFSRLSHDQSEFIDVDLNTTIADVVSEFEVLITERKAVIKTLGLPIVKGIPVQLHQLFSNLISNAIKFNHEVPQITITSVVVLDAEDILQNRTNYAISITDNGIGFAQQYADQAFQPFKRLTSEFEGTGIGLSLCKRIVENHKGSISVQSEPGKGTTFQIKFPRIDN